MILQKSYEADSELSELFDYVEMEDFLGAEGVDYRITPGTRGVQLNLRECPRCHGSEWKVYMNMDTGFGNCFHGSCVDEPGFNKFSFIKHLLNVSNREVIRIVKRYVMTVGWRPKRKIAVETTNEQEVKLPAHHPIPIDGKNIKYLSRRGIPVEIASYFMWSYSHNGSFKYKDFEGKDCSQDYSGRVILPIHDLAGNLVTFQGRDITGEADKKYLFPPGLAGSGRPLYNAHNCVGLSRIVINEGAFDVAACKMALHTEIALRDIGCIGTFGKHISQADGQSQTSALLEMKALGLEEITMMWDSEARTLDDAAKASTFLRSLGFKVYLAVLPVGKDPNECEPFEVVNAFKSAMLCTASNLLKFRMKLISRGVTLN
jgi:DNA primase